MASNIKMKEVYIPDIKYTREKAKQQVFFLTNTSFAQEAGFLNGRAFRHMFPQLPSDAVQAENKRFSEYIDLGFTPTYNAPNSLLSQMTL